MEGVDRLRERFEDEVRSWRMTSEAFAVIDSMLRDIEREHEGALKTDADSTSYQLGYMAGRAAAMREHEEMRRVEDTLREFAFQIGQSATDDGIVAKYAAKLRMAE